MRFLDQSVIAHPPKALGAQQRRFFAGIRHAILAMEVSYFRLLQTITLDSPPIAIEGLEQSTVVLFTDAWSIVDNGRRLQRLLWKFPSFSEHVLLQEYVSRWNSLRRLRDVAQHAERDYAHRLYAGNYVYGSLYWLDYRQKSENGTITAATRHAGPEANWGEFTEPFPPPINIDGAGGIDAIVLRSGGHELNLTDLITDSITTVSAFDHVVTELVMQHNARVVAQRPDQADHINDRLTVDWGFDLVVGPMVYGVDPSNGDEAV